MTTKLLFSIIIILYIFFVFYYYNNYSIVFYCLLYITDTYIYFSAENKIISKKVRKRITEEENEEYSHLLFCNVCLLSEVLTNHLFQIALDVWKELKLQLL